MISCLVGERDGRVCRLNGHGAGQEEMGVRKRELAVGGVLLRRGSGPAGQPSSQRSTVPRYRFSSTSPQRDP